MDAVKDMQATVSALVVPGKGILAADESIPTITKRFQAVGIQSNPDTRRAYRELLIGTPQIGEYLSGIILFEETLDQKASDGTPLPELCAKQGIVPGIKVDKGLVELPFTNGDKVSQGLDGLGERLATYKQKGARFAKWRSVYNIGAGHPTRLAIEANAEVLARYAAECQNHGIVPIVEPEVLIDGDHSIDQCAEVSEVAFHEVFHALHRHGVRLELIVLKPNMVIAGKSHARKSTPEEVADRTVEVLRRTVPGAVPTINFLSGGQTPEQASANLNAMNERHPKLPWNLSFSYARALQEPVMQTWKGDAKNVDAARKAFFHRAKLNGAAQKGQYKAAMEKA
ncbi:MAG: fructose-bisphosphate aldolase class I [Gammaproteobacteria bacterium]|nr:fructose-bisphosphate aldolase class I [Gammaproteobacteria bacterium]